MNIRKIVTDIKEYTELNNEAVYLLSKIKKIRDHKTRISLIHELAKFTEDLAQRETDDQGLNSLEIILKPVYETKSH